MKATAFEQRHAVLLRLCTYLIAFCLYFFDRVDVVWRFIRESPSRWVLEHVAFSVATLMIGAGAWLCTRAEACASDPHRHTRGGLFGDWLYAAGLSTLAPLRGCVVLVAGESLRILRVVLAERHIECQTAHSPRWGYALRRQATKWGVLLTMVAFSVSLVDRVADYGIAISVTLWAVLNGISFLRRDA